MLNSWWQDFQHAGRLVRNSPGFSAVIVVCLALGIGPTTTIFSLINASLMQPVDVADPQTLVTLVSYRAESDHPNESISYPNFADIRDRATTLAGVAVVADRSVSIRSGDASDLAEGALVSPNFFDLLGRKAIVGEVFHAAEGEAPGSQPEVVLGHAFWREHFHSDPKVIGTSMRINGHDFKILGVMPAAFTGTLPVAQPALWVPTTMMDEIRPDIPSQRTQRNHSWMMCVGRIRPGATIEQARTELAEISRALAAEYPRTNEFVSFTAEPFSGIPISAVSTVYQLVALAGIVVFLLLLLSCTSTAALQLARATVRRREIAIRMAIGATRWRIVRQLLVESVFLSLLAGGLALLLTLWAFELYRVLLPADWVRGIVLGSSIDWRVLAFTFVASLAAGILFGLAPAWQMSRPDLIAPLKSQDPGGDYGSTRVRNALVAAQFALAVMLLITAGLFIKGLRRAETLDPGFETERMVIFETDLSIYGYSMGRTQEFIKGFRERLSALDGVEAVSVSRFPPLSSSRSQTGAVPIADDLSTGEPIIIGTNVIGPGYFETIGVPFVAGRDFTDQDTRSSKPVVIVNEAFARRLGKPEELIGKLISGGGSESATVAGVVRDSKYWTLGEDDVPFAFMCMAQAPLRELCFCVRTKGDADAMKGKVIEEIRALNGDLAVSTVRTIGEHTYLSLQSARLSAILFMALGGLALVLAVVGVVGVVSYSVARRQLEIGIRMALGGQPRDLIALLVRRGLRLVVIGAAVGIAAAVGVTRFLAPLLTGTSPTDWQVFVIVPLVLLVVAWLAIYLPARKATSVDPMVVLRYE